MGMTRERKEAVLAALRVGGRILWAGVLGMLVFLAVNTSANLMQNQAYGKFINWLGAKIHEKPAQYGDAKGTRDYTTADGHDNWTMLAPHLKLRYYLGPGMKLGFALGLLAGGAQAAWEWQRRRRRREAGKEGAADGTAAMGAPPAAASAAPRDEEADRTVTIPRSWPLLTAAAGILFQGHILGLAAIVMAGRTRAGLRLAWLTRAAGAAVVLLWGVGSELPWDRGWADTYRPIADFLKWAEHVLHSLLGMN